MPTFCGDGKSEVIFVISNTGVCVGVAVGAVVGVAVGVGVTTPPERSVIFSFLIP